MQIIEETEQFNALIKSTSLGYCGGSPVMTCYLYLEYGNSWSQGFGGYCLFNDKCR
jgi:hypothetical protein